METGVMIRAALISAFLFAVGATSQAQRSPTCNFVSFKVALHAGENFERELGGGLLFRMTSGKQPGRFFDIVPAEAVSKDYIYPVNLPLRFNPNQTLGPGYGENVKSSLGYAHEMQFLIYKADYDQVWSLIDGVLWPDKVSDPERALAEFARAARRAKKGRLKVIISSYKTDGSGALIRIKLRVQITTPLEFQYAPGFYATETACPADLDFSVQ